MKYKLKIQFLKNMFCRICYETHTPLLAPCNCSGTIKYVHPSCLREWLEYKQSTVCDVCKTEYKIFQYFLITFLRFLISVIMFIYFCFILLCITDVLKTISLIFFPNDTSLIF